MTQTTKATRIELLGKEFHIKCPVDHEMDLQKAVGLLSEKMTEIRHQQGVSHFERALLIAALNLAYQANAKVHQDEKSIEERLNRIYEQIDRVLHPQSQLELNSTIE